MRSTWKLVAASHLAAAAVGFFVAPRELIDEEIKQAGFFTVDTKQVLAAAVQTLRAESKLEVYGFRSVAAVRVDRRLFWLLGGHQELIVPAAVTYYVDLSTLTLDRVTFDEKSQIVKVQLPRLQMGDVAFAPEAARTTNGGLLTWSQSQVDELGRLNYATARRAIVKQAQGAELVAAARRSAVSSVEGLFEVPLRIAGHPNVKVVATFASR